MLLTQIPNLLTLVRVAACPILVLLLHERNYELALYVFIAAGVTDGLDGYIAKKFDCVTSFGAVLDPIADKLLIGSAYIMLAILGDIPFWLLVVVMFRDLVIIVGYLILVVMGHDVPMRPTYLSKINTFMQISLMAAVLVEKAGFLEISALVTILIAGVLMTTIVSGVQYAWYWGIKQEFNGQPGK
jgi:cardiolipin synthase